MKGIKLLIVEEKGNNLKEITDAIANQPDIEILDIIEKSMNLMKGISENPDIILLNPSIFPHDELTSVLHKIKRKAPRAGTLILLKKDIEDKGIMEALIDGAKGYIKRSEVSRYLPDAIKMISKGEVWAERRILNRFLTGAPLIQKNIESKLKTIPAPLTKRETTLIHEVLKGSSNRDISKKYKITEMTVKTHLYRIYKKMKVKSRAQAIAYLVYP
ncbi:MAG: response regulator transcription factor [Nitrospirota bacterium]